jgi:hypothetical protein
MTAFDDLLTWRESSTSGEAIAAASEAAGRAPAAARDMLSAAERIVVTGAGSSYYLAQSVAAVARAVLRRTVIAAPLSELILRPEGALVGSITGAGGDGIGGRQCRRADARGRSPDHRCHLSRRKPPRGPG